MNRQVNRLAVVAIVLLVVLVGATTYWQTWAVAGLQDRQDNAIQQVEQFTVARGRIVSRRLSPCTVAFPSRSRTWRNASLRFEVAPER
jgi:cell division protein FtsI/penicillin-binding protein 2